MLKQPNEIYDLTAGPPGFSQGEGFDCREEVSEVPLNPWHEARDVQIPYLELLDIGQCGKLAQDEAVEQFL